MSQRRGQHPASEWDDWSTPAQPYAEPPPPANPPPTRPPAAYVYLPPTPAAYVYQPPAPMPMQTPTMHTPAPYATTPIPAPYVPPGASYQPQTGNTGKFMMPGMTSGSMTPTGSMGSMGGGAGAPPPPPPLDVSSMAAGAASFAGLDSTTASLAGNLAAQTAMNFAKQSGIDDSMIKSFTGSRLAVLRYYFDVRAVLGHALAPGAPRASAPTACNLRWHPDPK